MDQGLLIWEAQDLLDPGRLFQEVRVPAAIQVDQTHLELALHQVEPAPSRPVDPEPLIQDPLDQDKPVQKVLELGQDPLGQAHLEEVPAIQDGRTLADPRVRRQIQEGKGLDQLAVLADLRLATLAVLEVREVHYLQSD